MVGLEGSAGQKKNEHLRSKELREYIEACKAILKENREQKGEVCRDESSIRAWGRRPYCSLKQKGTTKGTPRREGSVKKRSSKRNENSFNLTTRRTVGGCSEDKPPKAKHGEATLKRVTGVDGTQCKPSGQNEKKRPNRGPPSPDEKGARGPPGNHKKKRRVCTYPNAKKGAEGYTQNVGRAKPSEYSTTRKKGKGCIPSTQETRRGQRTAP